MVNLKLTNFTNEEYAKVRDLICENLKGNPAFIDNDIIVSDYFAPANVIDITLCGGDDNKELYLQGSINSIRGLKTNKDHKYYIQTLNGSGIIADSKAEFLQRISDLIDQAHEQGQESITVDLDIYLKEDNTNV